MSKYQVTIKTKHKAHPQKLYCMVLSYTWRAFTGENFINNKSN